MHESSRRRISNRIDEDRLVVDCGRPVGCRSEHSHRISGLEPGATNGTGGLPASACSIRAKISPAQPEASYYRSTTPLPMAARLEPEPSVCVRAVQSLRRSGVPLYSLDVGHDELTSSRPVRKVPLEAILQYLKVNGEQLDADIARELRLPLEEVRSDIRELSAKGAVMVCFVTRHIEGRIVEGWTCRVSGFIPPAAPGRKTNPAK